MYEGLRHCLNPFLFQSNFLTPCSDVGNKNIDSADYHFAADNSYVRNQ